MDELEQAEREYKIALFKAKKAAVEMLSRFITATTRSPRFEAARILFAADSHLSTDSKSPEVEEES